jgi:diguanylate cyclase (GGDEF)-like protein
MDRGSLWIGGPDGLWRAPIEAGAPSERTPTDWRGLSDPNVFTMLGDEQGGLWIGTFNGLNHLDPRSGAIERIMADPERPSGLPGSLVSTLLIDRMGRLWVGIFGGGVAVMVGRDASRRPLFHRIGVQDGLPNANIDKLLMDGTGAIWASTDQGLAVIDPHDFRPRGIGGAYGGFLSIYWVKSGATDAWGEPMFGAAGGLAIMRPGLPAISNAPAPVVVTDVRIAGNPVEDVGRFNGAGSSRPLLLPPKRGSLEVEFAALDFSSPRRNRYAYRLEGFDRDWIATDSTRRLAAYTNLPPGDYVLALRGSNHDDAWSPDLRIPIRVLAAWYQTPWAEIGFVVAALAGVTTTIAVLVLRRTASLRARQVELERQIATRTADLRAANERLSQLVTTDPLTGCANRRRFMERAEELAELGRRGVPMSLAMVDLDNFKRINDSHGHPVGDEVLKHVGQIMRDLVRSTDILGRVGGEEFGLLLPNTRLDAARILVERMRVALACVEITVGELDLRVTASLGLAEQDENESFQSLYARADAALYVAKTSGRDRVIIARAHRAPEVAD